MVRNTGLERGQSTPIGEGSTDLFLEECLRVMEVGLQEAQMTAREESDFFDEFPKVPLISKIPTQVSNHLDN